MGNCVETFRKNLKGQMKALGLIKVECPNGKNINSTAETGFDWLAGGVGNFFSWAIIGWIVDPFQDKSYNIKDVSLGPVCGDSKTI